MRDALGKNFTLKQVKSEMKNFQRDRTPSCRISTSHQHMDVFMKVNAHVSMKENKANATHEECDPVGEN